MISNYDNINGFIETLILSTGKEKKLTNQQTYKFLSTIKAIYFNKKIQYNCIWDRMLSEKLRRPTRAIIEILEDCGFIKRVKKIVTSNNRRCWAFKFTAEFVELLEALKDYIFKKQGVIVNNINERIKTFCKGDIKEILTKANIFYKRKGNSIYFLDYVFSKNKNNLIFDKKEQKGINIFELLKIELKKDTFEIYHLFI